ncbi:23S rRNA pseudouridine(2604) synthase RluF [Alloiococcus sp. CFN-8]|uniref:23S rRNA pseudouridine(2604) synthase RluF n=1 Tax=Alloiococcus sp. CFN-8 TaxID=3416081 RepID=UPI003CEFA754
MNKRDSKPSNMVDQTTSQGIRINKFIGESGFCSRREADRYLESGAVKINDRVAVLGDKVFPGDKVTVKGKLLTKEEELVYIVLNKPVGITCTTDRSVKGNIIDYMNYPKRIFHVGRLDKPSQGLILMTNDGEIVNKILRSRNNHEKEYIVTVDKPITEAFIEAMSHGVEILDTVTKKCYVKKEGPKVFRIILTQGLNRQIRRMCETLGYNVTKLERIRIMNIKLKSLPIGQWRYVTPKEMKILRGLIEDSSKTEEASYEDIE